jgi:hypothetical protein
MASSVYPKSDESPEWRALTTAGSGARERDGEGRARAVRTLAASMAQVMGALRPRRLRRR